MRAFAGKQGPTPANACAVKRMAVFVFAVTIVIVAVPNRPGRRVHFQQGVDHLNRIDNMGIIRRAQAKANQGQRIRADNFGGRFSALFRWTILDGHKTLLG